MAILDNDGVVAWGKGKPLPCSYTVPKLVKKTDDLEKLKKEACDSQEKGLSNLPKLCGRICKQRPSVTHRAPS